MSEIVEQIRWGEEIISLHLEIEDLRYFCILIEKIAGIHLNETKSELIKTRLSKRLHATKISSFKEYRTYLESLSVGHGEWQELVNILTTNKTDFFREDKHFNYLICKFIPSWLLRNEQKLTIWCAASSTGEEAYSLAMLFTKYLPKDRDFSILATDIDTDVLSICKNAVYPINKMLEIPKEFEDLIEIGSREVLGWFRISQEVKNKVSFERHNLIESDIPGDGEFDIVFCRNVMIYFSNETIIKLSSKLNKATKKNGLCFIGHAESFANIKNNWNVIAPSVYKK